MWKIFVVGISLGLEPPEVYHEEDPCSVGITEELYVAPSQVLALPASGYARDCLDEHTKKRQHPSDVMLLVPVNSGARAIMGFHQPGEPQVYGIAYQVRSKSSLSAGMPKNTFLSQSGKEAEVCGRFVYGEEDFMLPANPVYRPLRRPPMLPTTKVTPRISGVCWPRS